MPLRKNTGTINAQANAFGALFNAGTLEIYTGSQPADPNSAASGSLLATITIPNPAFGAASGGVISKSGSWQVVATGTGAAGYCRMKSADTAKTLDIQVSETPGGNNVLISDINIVTGNNVQVQSLTVSVPAS